MGRRKFKGAHAIAANCKLAAMLLVTVIAATMLGCRSIIQDAQRSNPSQNHTQELSTTQALRTVRAESFGFRGEGIKHFLFEIEEVIAVYSYDSSGEKIFYTPEEYEVNYSLNELRRKPNSSIPDLNTHKVTFNEDGTFSFTASPRNPPVTVQMHTYVDYTTYAKFSPPTNRSILSDRNGDGIIKIYVYGDSIAAGAHTWSSYFHNNDSSSFAGILRRYFNSDSQILVINKSESNNNSDHFYNNYVESLNNGADIFLIEYGMNDHTAGDENIPRFNRNIEDPIIDILNHGRLAIIIGFFQQNTLWDRENRESTQHYNEHLKYLAAKHGINFVDIYKLYGELASKNIVDDITGDWLHNPNEFGHKFYFSALLPYLFKDENKISESNYIDTTQISSYQ